MLADDLRWYVHFAQSLSRAQKDTFGCMSGRDPAAIGEVVKHSWVALTSGVLFGVRVAACAWVQTAQLLAHFLPSPGTFVQVQMPPL